MSSVKENVNSATTTEPVQSAATAAVEISSNVSVTSATTRVATCSNETSISQQFKALGVTGEIKGGASTSSSTLLTAAAHSSRPSTLQSDADSPGPKRLIRKFTVIDPKKLQQAGLDRKIAEVLGRQKLMAAVKNLPGCTAVAASTIKFNTSTTATSTIGRPTTSTAASTSATAVSNPPKSIKIFVPPKITITRPAESPIEIKKELFGDMEKAMRLAHAKNLLNKKLLMKRIDQSTQMAAKQMLISTSTLTSCPKNDTSSSSSISVSTAPSLTGTISSVTTSATFNTAKNSKATIIDHPKLPTKPKETQSIQQTLLKKPSPNNTPQEIARVLDFDQRSELSSSLNDTTKPKGPPSKKPRQRQQIIKVNPSKAINVVKKTPAQIQPQPKYENAFANFVKKYVNVHGSSKVENITGLYDYIPKASIRSKSSKNENGHVPCTLPVTPSTSAPLSPSEMQKFWTSHAYYTQQQKQQQFTTEFLEVSPLKHPFPVIRVSQETPLPAIETVLPCRKPHAASTATSTSAPASSIKVESSDSCMSSLPTETNIFEICYLPTEKSASTSPQKPQSQQQSTGRNLIVLENKVLSQDEKIDLTALGLAQPKLEVLTTDAEHMEEFIKLPRTNAKVQREPKKLILAVDKLKLPPEKIAAMAKLIKSQTSEGFKKQSGTVIKMQSEIKEEPGIEEIMGVNNLHDNSKAVKTLFQGSSVSVTPQKRSASMERTTSNSASALDDKAPNQQKKLLTKPTALQQNEKSLPTKFTNVKNKSSQSVVFMPPPKHKIVLLNKPPTLIKPNSTVIKDNGKLKYVEKPYRASHIFLPNTSTSSSIVKLRKSNCEIIEEPVNNAEMSAVDFIASLSSANPITEETTMELSPEELNLNASFAMNLSPIRIPFSLQRDSSSKKLCSQSSESDTNALKSEVFEKMFTPNSNCDIQIGNIVTIQEENVFKTVIRAKQSENIIGMKQMENAAKHEQEKLEKKVNVVSKTQQNAESELKTTENRCNYPVDMDIDEPYVNEVEFRNLQPIEGDNALSEIHEIPVQETDRVLGENNPSFDQRQKFVTENPKAQNEFTLEITAPNIGNHNITTENVQENKQKVPTEHNEIKTTVDNVIDTVEVTKIDTYTTKPSNNYSEQTSTSNAHNTTDAPKRISRFKKNKVNLVQRKKSTITKPENEINQLVRKNQSLPDESETQEIENTIQKSDTDQLVSADTIDANAIIKCEVSFSSSQSVAHVMTEKSADSIESYETENTQLDKTSPLIAEIPKKANNIEQLLNPPKIPSKRKNDIGKEIAQALITNILAVEDRTINTNLLSLIQPKQSDEQILLTPAKVPFKKKSLELKTNEESAIGIKGLLRQMDAGKPAEIAKNQKSGEVEKTAMDKGLEKSPSTCAAILKDIISKHSNETSNKTENIEIPSKTIETNIVEKMPVFQVPQITNIDTNKVSDNDVSHSEKMANESTKHSEEKEVRRAEFVASTDNSNTRNVIKLNDKICNEELSANIESKLNSLSDVHVPDTVENNNALSSDSANLVVIGENTSTVHNFEEKIVSDSMPQIQSSCVKKISDNSIEAKDTCSAESTSTMSCVKAEDSKSMDNKNTEEKKSTSRGQTRYLIDTRAPSADVKKKMKNKSDQNSTIPAASAEEAKTVVKIVEAESEEETKKSDIGNNITKSIKSQRSTETHALEGIIVEPKNEQAKSNITKEFSEVTEATEEIQMKTRRFSAAHKSNTVVSKNMCSAETEIKESLAKVNRKSKGNPHEDLPCQKEISEGSKNSVPTNTELTDELSDSNILNTKFKSKNSSEVKKVELKRHTRLSIAMENREKKEPEYSCHETRRATKFKMAESDGDEKQHCKSNRNQNKVSLLKMDDSKDGTTRRSARTAAAKSINECSSTAKLNKSSKENISKAQPNTPEKQDNVEEDMEFLPLTPRTKRHIKSSTPQKVCVESTYIGYDDCDDGDKFKDESSQEFQPVPTRKRLRKTVTCTQKKRTIDTETESESEADDRDDGTVDDAVVCHEEFLGFDEKSPANGKMQKSLDMLISATSAEEEESCDEINNKSNTIITESSHKETYKAKPKSWLTTENDIPPTALQLQQIPSSANVAPTTNRSIPLKKRWELTQKTNDEVVVTDDTSPADDDEEDEEAYKNLVRLSLAKRKLNNIDAANPLIIAAKKLKLPPVQQIDNLENKQIFLKDKTFLKPKCVIATKNDASDTNEKVLVEESSSKKRTRQSGKKQSISNESTKDLNEESKGAVLISEATSETAAERELSKPKQLKKYADKELVELQLKNVKKQRKTKAKTLSTQIGKNEKPLVNNDDVATTSKSNVTKYDNDNEELLVAMRVEDFQALNENDCNTQRTRRSVNPKIETFFVGPTATSALPEVRERKVQKRKSAPKCGKIKSEFITNYFQLNDTTITPSAVDISALTSTKETISLTLTKEASIPTSTIPTAPVTFIQKQKCGRKRKIISNTNATATTENIPITAAKSSPVEEESTFNPRLLLVTNRAQVDTDETLTENQTNATGIAGGPTQCGLCLAHTTRSKWTVHLSKHYGVGWLVGEPQIMVKSRSAVINAIISYFKTTQIKGLTCRMCSRLYRSALGLVNHIETCGAVQARVICEYCLKDYTKLSLPVHRRTCNVRFQQERSKLEDASKDSAAVTAEVEVFNNVGRLKRASLMKAESKLKVIGEQLMEPVAAAKEFDPKEYIKYEAPLNSDFRDKWSQDLEKFGRVFCSIKVCKYTADDIKTMEEHLPSCRFQTKPGYHCLLCKKGTKVYANESDAIHHVTRKHRNQINKDFDGESSDCSIKTDDESSDDDCSSGVDSNEESNDMDDTLNSMEDVTSHFDSSISKSNRKSKPHKTLVDAEKAFYKVYTGRARNIQEATAKKWKKFIKENYVKDTLFTYALPIYNIANLSNAVDLEKLLPCQQTSMKFAFSQSREVKASIGIAEEIEWSELKRFETTDATPDHFIFIGAPIITLVWAPLPSDVPEQYLLINYRLNYTRTQNPKICQTLVLVYKVMQQQSTTKIRQSLPPKTELHYAFSIPDGPVHCMAFLPSGGYNFEMNRLGLLALGTATNTINIYALPLTINTPATSVKTDRLNIIDLKPALALKLDLRAEESSGHVLTDTQCTQICWSETKAHCYIFAGFANGFVGIWDIRDHQHLNRFIINEMRHFVPLNYFYVGERSIRSLAVHYDTSGPRWLAVAAVARHIYVFDIRDFSYPLLLKEDTVKNIVRSLDWCPVWESFVVSYCDAIPNFGRQLVAINPIGLMYHSSKIDSMLCGVGQTHYTPLQHLIVNGTDNGDLVILNPRELHYDDVLPKVQKNCRIVSMIDIKLLSGGNLSKEIPAVGFEMHEKNYKEKYGLVFKPMVKINPEQKSTYLNKERVPPRNVEHYMRINCLRWNFNANARCLVAVGYENGFLRIMNFNRDNYF